MKVTTLNLALGRSGCSIEPDWRSLVCKTLLAAGTIMLIAVNA
jgi:hypothetical protein